jgi:hypothetical protein
MGGYLRDARKRLYWRYWPGFRLVDGHEKEASQTSDAVVTNGVLVVARAGGRIAIRCAADFRRPIGSRQTAKALECRRYRPTQIRMKIGERTANLERKVG